jgi:hypothetical protein
MLKEQPSRGPIPKSSKKSLPLAGLNNHAGLRSVLSAPARSLEPVEVPQLTVVREQKTRRSAEWTTVERQAFATDGEAKSSLREQGLGANQVEVLFRSPWMVEFERAEECARCQRPLLGFGGLGCTTIRGPDGQAEDLCGECSKVAH